MTPETFKTDIVESQTPTLVDFWAPWCGPCKIQGPIVDDVAARVGGKYGVHKINVDDHPDLAQLLEIRAIPTCMIFADGKIAARLTGVQTADALVAALDSAAAA